MIAYKFQATRRLGEQGWMSRVAEHLGVDRSSVSRCYAGLAAPGPVAAAVEAWLLLYRLTGARPDELGGLAREHRFDSGGDATPDRGQS